MPASVSTVLRNGEVYEVFVVSDAVWDLVYVRRLRVYTRGEFEYLVSEHKPEQFAHSECRLEQSAGRSFGEPVSTDYEFGPGYPKPRE